MQSDRIIPVGELRVNAPASFAELHMMKAVAEYSETCPDVRVHMNLTDRFVDLVEEGVDVAIRIGELEDSSLIARRIGATSMLLCAAPAYLEHHPMPSTVTELADHHCLLDTNYRDGPLWQIGQGIDAEVVRVKERIAVNSARAALELLLAGQGIGYLPSFVVAESIVQGRLVQLFPSIPPQQYVIHAVYTHRKQLSAKVRLFIECVARHLKATGFG